jgi:hypothetical protein
MAETTQRKCSGEYYDAKIPVTRHNQMSWIEQTKYKLTCGQVRHIRHGLWPGHGYIWRFWPDPHASGLVRLPTHLPRIFRACTFRPRAPVKPAQSLSPAFPSPSSFTPSLLLLAERAKLTFVRPPNQRPLPRLFHSRQHHPSDPRIDVRHDSRSQGMEVREGREGETQRRRRGWGAGGDCGGE